MRTYATEAEVTTWLDLQEPPAGIVPLIRSASLLVESATINDLYDTDASGMPTSTPVLETFRDTVCSQIETWIALGIDPVKGAADAGKTVASKSIRGASISYAASSEAAQARARAATALSADAAAILRQGRLGSSAPWSPA